MAASLEAFNHRPADSQTPSRNCSFALSAVRTWRCLFPLLRHVELTGRLTPREMHLGAYYFDDRTTARVAMVLFRPLPQAMTPSPSTFHSIALLSTFFFARRFSLRLRLRSSASWSIFSLL